jgi:hypothetical protein
MEVLGAGGRWPALTAIAVLATIALVAAGASTAEAVPIERGHTRLILNQNTLSNLDPLGIGILPIPPAEARTGAESFPITGGTVSRNGRGARIDHGGGIRFADNNARVRVTRVTVRLHTNGSELIASIDGQRMSFLSLQAGRRTSAGRGFTFHGIRALLTHRAANALNQGFATDFFQRGTRLGQLRIQTTLVR